MKGHPMDEVEKLSNEIEIWVSRHSQPFYEKGPFGETDTIKSDEFCPALARFVLRREIEARIDELMDVKLDNMISDRLTELRRELEVLGEKCK